LLADAQDLLEHLKSRATKIAVLTDGPEVCQAAKVAALGVAPYAEAMVLTGAYGPGFSKPHPRGYQDVARATGADHLVYIADNPHKDFVAAKQLGWSTVRVKRPGGLHENVPDGPDVDLTVLDLSHLPHVLRSFGLCC
jgi:putative hydrolase of the HAD superfamily